ncbi:hypothetical protein KJ611_02280 [Patescibacteria group bacterium]|nr:hypothetical protein [Patescibacteria group bacterium]
MEIMTPLLITLSIIWFVAYWVLGGVFFAVIALLRLGRVRKVRFSCLFTFLAMACAVGAAYGGLRYSSESVNECLLQSDSKAESLAAIFGCGLASIMAGFLIGALGLIVGGFIIMAISKSKTKPWINLNHNGEGDEEDAEEANGFFK